MDVLNSIWVVLNTDNEMLTKIVTAPTVIIEAWLAFLLIVSILQINYTFRQKIAYIGLLSIISLVAEFFMPTPYNVFVNYFTMFIVIKSVLHTNIIKTILAIIIPTVTFALIGNLILNPLLKIFNITTTHLMNSILYRAIYLFVLYLFAYIIVFALQKRKLSLNILSDLDKKSKNLILINLLFGAFTIAIQLVITFYYVNTFSLIFTLLNFISLFLYFFISFYSLTRVMKLQITTQELENAENYNNTLSYLYDNVKSFKHDFNNMIFIIGGFINNNDMDGLKRYYIDLEKDCERVNSIEILNPKIINNPGIYNLLVAKYNKAEQENVKISLEFFFDFERLHMPFYEFTRMLGILLYNSIEAAAECEEKQVNIMFRDSSKHKTQIIKIENTYSNKDVDISQIFEKGITEKENHMGMGLWEINQIVKRNNNIKLLTTKNEKYFVQQLEIYY